MFVGPPPSIAKIAAPLLPKNFVHAYNPDINAFFRTRTTIHVGDTVSFKFRGFHDVDLPGKAGTRLPLIVPGTTLATGNDAAGNPFWFSGHLPAVGFNPALMARSKSTTYNGSARLVSGLGQGKPFNIKFSKTGTFTFYCDVHPGMVGTIVVKPKPATIPTAKQDTAAANAQVTADVKAAKALPKTKMPANTVSLGESAPGRRRALLDVPRQVDGQRRDHGDVPDVQEVVRVPHRHVRAAVLPRTSRAELHGCDLAHGRLPERSDAADHADADVTRERLRQHRRARRPGGNQATSARRARSTSRLRAHTASCA